MITQFLTVREEWNRYRVSDGTHFRFKIPLLSVNIVSIQDRKVSANFGQLFFKEPHPDDKGITSPNPIVTDADVVEKLKFEREYESLNIYDIPDIKQVLLCKPYLVAIEKTDKFDAEGNRIYRNSTNVSFSAVPYPGERPEQEPQIQRRLA